MRFTQIWKNGRPALGIVTKRGILDAEEGARLLGRSVPADMMELIKDGGKALPVIERIAQRGTALMEGPYAPVITGCEKVLCIGLNYRQHAAESKMEIPAHPVLFNKFANALAGHGQKIRLLPDYEQYDYEAELVVVIGRDAKNVPEEEALDYVFGYTCGNDLSTRDLQFSRGAQWVLSKSFDGFAPVGPVIVTADEIDPGNLGISCTVNGEVRQNSNTSDLVFPVSALIADLSKHMTLRPGDIIFTGTPSGVMLGYPEDRKDWLKAGDTVEILIEGIGTLRNTMTE